MARRVIRLKIMILHLAPWRILVSCGTFKTLDLRLRDVCRVSLLYDTIYQRYLNILCRNENKELDCTKKFLTTEAER